MNLQPFICYFRSDRLVLPVKKSFVVPSGESFPRPFDPRNGVWGLALILEPSFGWLRFLYVGGWNQQCACGWVKRFLASLTSISCFHHLFFFFFFSFHCLNFDLFLCSLNPMITFGVFFYSQTSRQSDVGLDKKKNSSELRILISPYSRVTLAFVTVGQLDEPCTPSTVLTWARIMCFPPASFSLSVISDIKITQTVDSIKAPPPLHTHTRKLSKHWFTQRNENRL